MSADRECSNHLPYTIMLCNNKEGWYSMDIAYHMGSPKEKDKIKACRSKEGGASKQPHRAGLQYNTDP